MYILGINAYHGDAAACLLENGKIIFAVEEERFTRIKHWAGFPGEAISKCLDYAGISLSNVESVAINTDPKANFYRKMAHVLRHRVDVPLILERLRNSNARKSLPQSLNALFPDQRFDGNVYYINHHLAHLASAFYASPFSEAAIVSVDGFGDFASGSWGVGSKCDIKVKQNIFYPHSLGAFYQALTQFIGFPHYGDEYKVMGLAPYGDPVFMDEMRDIVQLKADGTYSLNLKYFVYHKQKTAYEWSNGSPSVGTLFSNALKNLLGPSRNPEEELSKFHKDIAASAQKMFEEALFHMLNGVYAKTGLDHLCLAGGCGNNSVANGKIRGNTDFKEIYVAASAGDAGGAIGAAYCAFHENRERSVETSFMNHAYLGPSFDNDFVGRVLDESRSQLDQEKILIEKIDDLDRLAEKTALEIADGRVVGWFQGRMEWGPRALGNRSILGDPRRPDMKEILNLKIKRRESFRPFAPSILRERVNEWFEEDDDVPFMMKVFPIKETKRELIPAVTHVDGSGRLQTVNRGTNPRYHKLISTFDSLTGVPIVLNTSFNENEPVVCTPTEALNCFLRTRMDVLVMNDYFLSRCS